MYDEESKKELQNKENSVIITELKSKKHIKTILLKLENNSQEILKYGTTLYLIDFLKYIKDNNININEYKKLTEFFECNDNLMLLIGIKLNESINIM